MKRPYVNHAIRDLTAEGLLQSGSLASLASALIAHKPRPSANQLHRQLIAALCAQFHRAIDVDTAAVASTIASIASGAPIVLFAHQPDAFPSEALAGVHLIMDELTQFCAARYGVTVAPLHVLMDTDDSAEQYFRGSRFPTPSLRSGHFPLHATAERLSSDYLMRSVGSARADWISSLVDRLWRVIAQELAWCKRLDATLVNGVRTRFEQFDAAVRNAYCRYEDRHHSLSDQNAALLVRYSSTVWQTRVACLRYSDLIPHVNLDLLAREWPKLREIRRMHISSLERRFSGLWSSAEDARMTSPFWTVCRGCGHRRVPESLGHLRCTPVTGWQPTFDRLPRVALEDYLLTTHLPVSLEISYAGGAQHKLISWFAARSVGVESPLLIWNPTVNLAGYALAVAATARGVGADGAQRLLENRRASFAYAQVALPNAEYRAGWSASWVNHSSSNRAHAEDEADSMTSPADGGALRSIRIT